MGLAAPISTYRWTREEYDALAAQGFFAPDRRLQLIEGEIYDMSPQGSKHTTAARFATLALEKLYSDGYDIRVQFPLALGASSEPEPDIAVVEGQPGDYRDAHPQTAVLVVEVSDTSLAFDRTVKLSLYAQHGLPEYWILNLEDERLEVYRQPMGAEYRQILLYRTDDEVSPLGVESSIAVADLLP